MNAQSPSYTVIVEGFDWGPGISSLVLDLGQAVAAASVNPASFVVKVERTLPGSGAPVQVVNKATHSLRDSRGQRTITAAYLSDAKGNHSAAASGPYITLDLAVGPEEDLASPFDFSMKTYLNDYVTVNHTILVKAGLRAATGNAAIAEFSLPPSAQRATINKIADDFDTSGRRDFIDPVFGKITLRYASYAPRSDNRKHPLIIWLNGAGESGTNPIIVLLGNRVTALADSAIQTIFGGAFVLAPQSEVVWMNNGHQAYPTDGSTQFTAALKDLIDAYVAANKNIDRNRIYIGGCSNGGFMTMKMILTYPDFFAAAYPICEAYADRWISNAQINSIKNLPIWFTQAKTDTTVNAAVGGYVLETYQRLIAAGGGNVHLSYWEKVVDLSGRYFQSDGKKPYEYNGHWSWIYTLNNQCRNEIDGQPVLLKGQATTIMEWLAAQSK